MNREEMKKLAEHARLILGEDEIGPITDNFNSTVEFIGNVKNIDVDKDAGFFTVNRQDMPLREDVILEGITQEEAVRNTKTEKYGYFEILRFVE